LVNDHQHPIAKRPATRAESVLPERGVVFACFNNSYKIEPRIFDAWMAILAEVSGSVLWLSTAGPAFEANLRREAEARGIAPGRLRARLAEHRASWPLFDAPRFARNLERAYRTMWDLHASGRPPQPITVVEPP